MSLPDIFLGKRLASFEEKKEQLSVLTGVPVLGLDALASTAYGPEAALTILLPLGIAGLQYFPFIALAIVLKLAALYLSYQQTAAAYPDGGGAYIVANDNLGTQPALLAAIALLLDYLLNVAVGIAAGAGAVVSAIPVLQPYTLPLCLAVLLTLTVLNLRGVRQSGLTFVVPVLGFVGCLAIAMSIGLIRAWQTGGHPEPVLPPPALPEASTSVSAWLLLGAFANGLTAMTGVEAVSNGVPLFREPRVPNAQRTLTVIVGILGLSLLALGYLCPVYHIGAMDEQQPGYQTILSQLIGAVAGRGAFYYMASACIFIVLTYSAQTSFADFPRVCRLLAADDFLPRAFANRGRRLVFSNGIIVLTILSALLLTAFQGQTNSLIPLFAVGAFSAFLFSQAGMVVHWARRPGRGVRVKLFYNGFGAVTTTLALIVIIVAKFAEGAWMTIVSVPTLFFLLRRINHHFKKIEAELGEPLELNARESEPPVVIVPIDNWDRRAERAVRFGLALSNDVIALHVVTEPDDRQRIRELWRDKVDRAARAAHAPVPLLEIVDSPYRRLFDPILEFVNRARDEKPGRVIAW